MSDKNSQFSLDGLRVWVAGHRGMVGSALVRRLARENCEILTVDRKAVDFGRQAQVEDWTAEARPDVVIIAAARVGGILANSTWPADFIYENLTIEANLIHAAHRTGVKKLLFLGSSCIYPRDARQPMAEDALLTGPLEPTNQWYAIAKIAGIKLCQAYRQQHGRDFISAMPTNLYGIGDNFDPVSSHVAPALIAKTHKAKMDDASTVEIWGSGKPRRELLEVDDCADALVFMLKNYSGDVHVNVGTGQDITIAELARIIARVVGFQGGFAFDSSKPDGTPRKVLDVGMLNRMGWQAKTSLEDGLHKLYEWYLRHEAKGQPATTPANANG